MSIAEQETDENAPEAAPKKRKKRREPRRRVIAAAIGGFLRHAWPALLAVAVAVGGFGVAHWKDARVEKSPEANRALVDKGATDKVVADVSNAVARIFTYSYTNPGATEQAATDVLVGAAAGQYRTLFGQVRAQAPAQKLALTTRVSRAGLVRLTRDGEAVLVVFLDQQATRAGKAAGSPVAAQLVVTARDDHGWRISDIRAA
ncbi:hypothetical protein [Actinomadura atramentaria]|uniref:hypothetical protein n=1 Tax=Actinomadura atramentaria TaxID=1990 RepID=UPI000381346F|nr:hypothetical protein [Actinomadura atramentaria]